MKQILCAFLTTLLLFSCSDSNNSLGIDEPEINNPDEQEQALKLSLGAKSTEGNIFELMEFNIYSNKSYTMLHIGKLYDSITWEVAGLKGRYDIYSHRSGSAGTGSHYSWMWSHNFFIPAKYNVYLLGYKNDKIVYSDTVTINISDKKDFLSYNWTEIKSPAKFSTGYHDALVDDSHFSTYADFEDGVPSVSLLLKDDKSKDQNFAEKSKTKLYNFINTLYDMEPTYGLNNNEIKAKYKELFRNTKEYFSPLCIWITPKARITLVRDHNSIYSIEYKIYAEPNN